LAELFANVLWFHNPPPVAGRPEQPRSYPIARTREQTHGFT